MELVNIIEPISYESYKQRLIDRIKAVSPDIILYESSDEMVMLEAFAYELVYRDAQINERIRQILPIYAKGVNLDIACQNYYGTTRLTDETDEAFLQRSIESMDAHNTAGASGSYIFYAKSVDSRVNQVQPYRSGDGEVTIVWNGGSLSVEEALTINGLISQKLNEPDIRPLCETQIVKMATKIIVDVVATITIKDVALESEVRSLISSKFDEYFSLVKIGENVSLSKIISLLHVDGVSKVSCPMTDIEINSESISLLGALNVTIEDSTDEY